MRHLLEDLLLPPCSAVLLLLAGMLLARWRPRLARGLRLCAFAWLWLAATPAFAGALLGSLQQHPALPAYGPLPGADAIVVLSAEADPIADEYGRAVAGPMTMQRLRYGAWLHRRTGLPLLVSGGRCGADWSLAGTMAQAAEREFGVPVRWREDRSRDTLENARHSAARLRDEGVRTVLLVTHAWHMPRAVACFEAMGLEVIAAPTGFRLPSAHGLGHWLPQWHGLRDTALALHEFAGFLQLWSADHEPPAADEGDGDLDGGGEPFARRRATDDA